MHVHPSGIRNWTAGDPDRDGVRYAADNCPVAVNPDQADLDSDGLGDVCDPDDDNDGLSDTTESEIGTDPANADTDGDGKADGADSCPKLAGTGDDGCPVATTAGDPTPPPAGGTPQPGTTDAGGTPQTVVAPQDTDPRALALRLRRSVKVGRFLRGVPAAATCDEPCLVEFTLLGEVRDRGIRLAAFNHIFAQGSLGLGGGQRSVKLRPCRAGSRRSQRRCRRSLRRAVRRARRARMRVVAVASDAAGNRTRRARTFRVR